MTILLVDDDKTAVRLLAKFLLSRGYDVDAVFDGQTALIRINKKKYDLVMVDHNMPELSGLEVIKNARALGFTGKFVMITSYCGMEKPLAQLVGADEYLEKPVDYEKIELVLKKYSV